MYDRMNVVDNSKFYFVYFLAILSDQWWPTFQLQNGLGGRQPRPREESFKYEVGLINFDYLEKFRNEDSW